MVKQNDMASTFPHGDGSPRDSYKFTYYSFEPNSSLPRNQPRISANFSENKYNEHAKNGFRYWYAEKPGVSCKWIEFLMFKITNH